MNRKFERLQKIIGYISSSPRTKKQILKYMNNEVTGRTLQRYFDTLQEQGYEIEYKHGLGYVINSDYSYEEELQERFRNSLLLKQVGDPKLDIDIITSSIYKDLDLSIVPKFAELIAERRMVSFVYKPFNEPQDKYKICPLALKEFKGNWHVVGYNPKDQQFDTYGMDRIKELEIGESYDPEEIEGLETQMVLLKYRLGTTKTENMEGYLRKGDRPRPIPIKLFVSDFLIRYWESKPIHFTQKITGLKKDHKNYVTGKVQPYHEVTFELVPNYDLIKLILAEVGDVIIAEPKELVQFIQKNFKGLVEEVTKPIR
jgi:predicted DNA-binding transcriptional regulator YafY